MKNRLLAFATCLLFTVLHMPAQTPPPLRVALLLDDGPTSDQLEKYIELFQREKIPATFSFIAKNAVANSTLAKSAIAAGHEVVNHSFEHLHPAGLGQLALNHEVQAALEALEKATGMRPSWYWPPYVEITPDLEKTVARTSMKLLRPTHLVSSDDWNTSVTAAEIRTKALTGLSDGTVILFHEWRRETLNQMPAIIAELKQRGATFLTISGLSQQLEKNNARPASQ